MSHLDKAPLVEVIFELKWGQGLQGGVPGFGVQSNEDNLFLARFPTAAGAKGFGFVEVVNAPPVPIPHIVSTRYRRTEGTWPCYQIGNGLLTVNQVNDGYDWSRFKDLVSEALELVDTSHPSRLAGLPLHSLDLRYQDGFPLEIDEEPLAFLAKKMQVEFGLPKGFLNPSLMDTKSVQTQISFQVQLSEPIGLVACVLAQGAINGRPGFILDTVVRSTRDAIQSLSNATVREWLERAHVVQKQVFETMISPAYMRTFK